MEGQSRGRDRLGVHYQMESYQILLQRETRERHPKHSLSDVLAETDHTRAEAYAEG